jgi:hypothetical protein
MCSFLSFADFVIRDGTLCLTLKTAYIFTSQFSVLRSTCFYPFTPQSVATRFQFSLHERFHVILLQPELHVNGLKRRAVFPCHLDNAVGVFSVLHDLKTREAAHSSEKWRMANGEWQVASGEWRVDGSYVFLVEVIHKSIEFKEGLRKK